MASTTDWWTTFFNGVALEMWRAFATDERNRADADFITARLGLSPGSRVLDVPCGHARIAIELASRGYRMTGLDLAPEEIDFGRRRAAPRGLELELVQGDMQRLTWNREFDGAFSFGNSFAYFDDAGNRRFLDGVLRALVPGGRFILDTGLVSEAVYPNLEERAWYPFGTGFFLARRILDPTRSRLTSEYTFIVDGKQETRTALYRVYPLRELLELFTDLGFEVEATLGSLAGEPFKLGSHQLLLIARRPA